MYIYLQRIGIIGGEGVKRLVIIADNCPGQNKNNCVFKFCCWLVEAGWAKEVVMMFLIKGHTKNECGSKFNCLKKGLYSMIICTEQGLDAAYTKQNADDIRLTQLPEGETRWKGFTEGLGRLYRDIDLGQSLKNHIFTFGGANPNKTTVTRQLYRDDAKIQYNMMPTARSRAGKLTQEGRVVLTRDLYALLPILPAPGSCSVKETDLYEKVNQIIQI